MMKAIVLWTSSFKLKSYIGCLIPDGESIAPFLAVMIQKKVGNPLPFPQ